MQADREYLQRVEEGYLAGFATKSSASCGRKYPEPPHRYRTDFQRDRERIIHSKAFRRLEYKTQVFINSEGDHYRTRLTHTIEVAQIARTIARALRLNEDLAESIALAHDLGHTPFGHAGERMLNEMLSERGGFEHNRQSLRVVDVLERNYGEFPGLNLSWETREGIIKHSPKQANLADEFRPAELPSLEAQIIELADEIAYNSHDLDDGISAGVLKPEEAAELGLWRMAEEAIGKPMPQDVNLKTRIVVRSMINILASDLINTTLANIERLGIETVSDVRQAKERLVRFGSDIGAANAEIKTFLKENLYRHYRVLRMTIKAERVIKDLFQICTEHPETMPAKGKAKEDIFIAATDYIASMTDRFALEEHSKLTDPAIGA